MNRHGRSPASKGAGIRESRGQDPASPRIDKPPESPGTHSGQPLGKTGSPLPKGLKESIDPGRLGGAEDKQNGSEKAGQELQAAE